MTETRDTQIGLRRADRPPIGNIRYKRVLRWSPKERMLRLFRIMWQRGKGDIGFSNPIFQPYDVKLSFAIEIKLEDSWVGVFWKKPREGSVSKDTFVYVCIVPWFPIRIHYSRSHGGRHV